MFGIASGAQTHAGSAATATADTISGPVMQSAVVRAARQGNCETVPAQILEGRQLQRLGGHSVADAIRFFSGVQIKDYGGIGGLKTINVHGMGSEHVGVVYDGIPIDNAQNGQIDLGRFSLDNMESIALYTGGRADILQPARNFASASTVYLQTRTPSFEGDTVAAGSLYKIKTCNVKGTFRTGSFGLFNPLVRWEQRWNDRLSSSLSAEYLYTDGKYRYRYRMDGGYDTTATRHNGDVDAVRAETALFGKLRNGNWRAQGYLYRSRRGLPGAVVRNRLSNIDRQNDLNTFLQASLNKRNGRYTLLANAKYAYDYLRYVHDSRLDNSTMYIDNRYRQHEVYISAAQRYGIMRNWDVSLSADYMMNALEADLNRFARPLRHSFYIAPATAWNTTRTTLQANVLLTHINNRVRRKESGKPAEFTEITPAFYASCKPFTLHDLTLRAFYKKIFRMPTLNDLYYTFLGNSDLKPEYATQYDAGMTYRKAFKRGILRAVGLKADFYFNKVSDKIVAVPTANLFRWTMTNIGSVKIHGADIAAQAELNAGALAVHAKATYTYQRAKDCSDRRNRYYGGQIPYIPRHSASAVIGAELRDWALNYSYIYTGERYDASANIPANYIHPWRTHDASISRNLRFGRAVAEIMLAVNNIFNQHYEVVRCYPMPGRNYKITLSANF